MTTAEIEPARTTATAGATKKVSKLMRLRQQLSDWLKPPTLDLEQKSATELAESRTDLAATRTLMAADRTLMAWMRTALSLLSFGFTIYKILEGFQSAGRVLPQGDSPRNIGIFLSAMGTLAMIMGTIEYWAVVKELRKLQPVHLARPSFVMAVVMSVIGVFTFFSITLHLF
jgi:putative membrane protein